MSQAVLSFHGTKGPYREATRILNTKMSYFASAKTLICELVCERGEGRWPPTLDIVYATHKRAQVKTQPPSHSSARPVSSRCVKLVLIATRNPSVGAESPSYGTMARPCTDIDTPNAIAQTYHILLIRSVQYIALHPVPDPLRAPNHISIP